MQVFNFYIFKKKPRESYKDVHFSCVSHAFLVRCSCEGVTINIQFIRINRIYEGGLEMNLRCFFVSHDGFSLAEPDCGEREGSELGES